MKETALVTQIIEKKCSHCGASKRHTEFYFSKRNKDGLHNWCKECSCVSRRSSYQRNKVQVLAHSKEYNRKTGYLYQKKFAKSHPGYAKYSQLSHRVKGKLAIASRAEFIEWYTTQTKECYYCGVRESLLKDKYFLKTQRNLHLDRRNSRQGYVITNIALACWMCNLVKSNILTEREMKIIGPEIIKIKHLEGNPIS